MAPPVKRIQTASEELNRVQDSILPTVNALRGCPILDGRITDVIQLRAASGIVSMVEHGLGREPLGWWVIDQDQQSDIWEEKLAATNPDRTKFLRIAGSADVDITLWVF